MWKIILLLIVVSANEIAANCASASITTHAIATVQNFHINETSKTAALKKQADDMGLDTGPCSVFNASLIILQKNQILAITAEARIFKAAYFFILSFVLDLYQKQCDLLVSAHMAAYTIAIIPINSCYNNLICCAPPTTAPTNSTTTQTTSTSLASTTSTSSATTTTSVSSSTSATEDSNTPAGPRCIPTAKIYCPVGSTDKVCVCYYRATNAISTITSEVQVNLTAIYDQRAVNTMALKNKALALGQDRNACSAQENALSGLQASQRAEIVDHATKKQALLDKAMMGYCPGATDADTRNGVCTTYETTEPEYRTEMDNLVIADDPVELYKVQELDACYQGY